MEKQKTFFSDRKYRCNYEVQYCGIIFLDHHLCCRILINHCGNIIAIVVFWKLRWVLKKTYCLLINLTVADLIVGFSAIEQIANRNIKTLKNSEEFPWRGFPALNVFSGTASLATLLLVAVERCYAIVYPFRHRALRTRIYKEKKY